MKTVSIRELHTRTGFYVRAAARQPIAVTDRGETVAVIQSASPSAAHQRPFPKRDRSHMPVVAVDSSDLIADDRGR